MTKSIQYRNLPLLLAQARESVIANFRPLLRHIGLTEQQWRIMRVLNENTALRPSQISEICQILPPSLTGVLNRLEEMGLIEKQRFDKDPRQMLVANSAKGKELVRKVMPYVEAQYHEMEKLIGADLLVELYDVLDKLLTTLHEPVPQLKLPRLRKAAAKGEE